MNINTYYKKTKFQWITVWVFGGTFIGTFGILWTFIEPFGGLCKLPFFKGIENCEENITTPYFLLLLISFIIAVIVESIRYGLTSKNYLRRLLLEIENEGLVAIEPYQNFIELDESQIFEFLTSDVIESEFTIPIKNLKDNSILFLSYFFKLCVQLGLYIQVGEKYTPSGHISPFIIKSVISSIKQNTELFTGVKAHEASPENKELRELLKKIEKIRVDENKSAIPIRKIQSSIILIKANGEDLIPRFLLQKNTAWGEGYYWWIGGIQEIKDNDMIECAKRELNEELSVKASNILNLTFQGTAKENIVSDRLGAYTSYSYNIFTLNLKNLESLSNLFFSENKINLPLEGFHVEREIKWFKWEELKSNKDLQRDAGSILRFIESKELQNDFLSCQKIIK